MIHFLRNEKNRTIIECSVYGDDLHTATNIEEYSKMLIDLYNKNSHTTFIESISSLDELRGWWWESEESYGRYDSIDQFVKEKFLEVANKFELNYVTD